MPAGAVGGAAAKTVAGVGLRKGLSNIGARLAQDSAVVLPQVARTAMTGAVGGAALGGTLSTVRGEGFFRGVGRGAVQGAVGGAAWGLGSAFMTDRGALGLGRSALARRQGLGEGISMGIDNFMSVTRGGPVNNQAFMRSMSRGAAARGHGVQNIERIRQGATLMSDAAKRMTAEKYQKGYTQHTTGVMTNHMKAARAHLRGVQQEFINRMPRETI